MAKERLSQLYLNRFNAISRWKYFAFIYLTHLEISDAVNYKETRIKQKIRQHILNNKLDAKENPSACSKAEWLMLHLIFYSNRREDRIMEEHGKKMSAEKMFKDAEGLLIAKALAPTVPDWVKSYYYFDLAFLHLLRTQIYFRNAASERQEIVDSIVQGIYYCRMVIALYIQFKWNDPDNSDYIVATLLEKRLIELQKAYKSAPLSTELSSAVQKTSPSVDISFGS